MDDTQSENLKAAFRYLDEYGFSVIPVGQSKQPLVPWKDYQERYATPEEVAKWFSEFPDANIAIVTGRISNLTVVDVEKGGNFHLPRTFTVRSGGDGRHFYYRYAEGVNNKVRVLERTDIRGTGGYVVAAPSFHQSGKRYEIIDDSPIAEFPAAFFAEARQQQSGPKDWTVLMAGTVQGSRNESAAVVAGKFIQSFGSSPEDLFLAWQLLAAWNERNKPPLPEGELRQVFKSIAAKDAAGTRTGSSARVEVDQADKAETKWRFWTMGEFLAQDFGPEEWLVESLVLQPSIVALSGNPGNFKTTIATHIAQAVARGTPVFGQFATKQGPVLMIDEENHQRHMQKRFLNFGASEDDNIFYLSHAGVKLDQPESCERILKKIKAEGIKLVTLDSFVDMHSQQENDAVQMQVILAALREFAQAGASVVFLHHPTKPMGSSGLKTHQFLRGSSNILAQIDTHFHVEKEKDENLLVIRNEKMRDAGQKRPFEVEIQMADVGGEQIPRGLAYLDVHDDEATKAEQASEAVVNILEDGKFLSRKAVHEELKEEFGKMAIDKGIGLAEKREQIERVPKEDLPTNANAREHHYRSTHVEIIDIGEGA
ncbi:MAG: hypothetical protein A3I31_00555 [Candidatus Colwellbacteria bacterium RIFCSPLOWO2_02_FULL_44_20b]|uniref:DNA primase/polymerase bifunctional N-terminal domain-containing protein n=1 Tax=Candidatus Colwellbacteria bacterium RIFCSPLOWO2_02_FULL_44_20b TaxID=1797691 RepID=A0A1G1Z5D4_9BACT|nr:MAG: hypothetical protein A3I31_00555 [Candidatus Colwellbacteria bacterium RIFCSPLOWO2_02_FULL_44_20b]